VTPAEVAPGVHRLGSEWVNWYLVDAGEEGLVAVDAGLPAYGDLMLEQFGALGRRPDEVRAVVLTHGHSDHTGLAKRFADSGARVLVHEEDLTLVQRPRPQKTDANPLAALRHGHARRFFWHMTRNGALRPTKLADAETYADGAELDVPGSPRAIHTPGHTVGHCALHFAGHDVLFVADLLCTLNPVTGQTGIQTFPPQFNVDTRQSVQSLNRIEDLSASRVLPGHGHPFEGSPADAAQAARAVGVP
jgi:glyoxylase-like metal-dependent hydrolase (beta-lactamase superfamily II)